MFHKCLILPEGMSNRISMYHEDLQLVWHQLALVCLCVKASTLMELKEPQEPKKSPESKALLIRWAKTVTGFTRGFNVHCNFWSRCQQISFDQEDFLISGSFIHSYTFKVMLWTHTKEDNECSSEKGQS